MAEALEGNLPMEERNLLRIHQQTLKRKKRALREEIHYINPLHTTEEEIQPLLNELEEAIVQWTEPSNGWRKVTEGTLYPFTTQNSSASREHCERLLSDLMKVHEKFQKAVRDSLPLKIGREVGEITAEYNRRAVGPAAREVLERGLSELNKLSNTLKKIPGAPQSVKVLGIGSDKVKLCWEPPLHNPDAVEEYVVYKNEGDGDLKEAARTEKTRVLVKGLEPNVKHTFCVMATNSIISEGLKINTQATTKFSAGNGAVIGAVASLGTLSFFLRAANVPLPKRPDAPVLKTSTRLMLVTTGVVMLPFTLVLLPVTLPLAPLAAAGFAIAAVGSKTGDLTEK